MTYIKWRDADGYETGCRECLDLSSFAADLCKALDGKPISTNDRDGYATFELADGCMLSLSNSWRSNEADKVTVHIDPPDELDRLRGYDLSAEHRLPASVTVSARLPDVSHCRHPSPGPTAPALSRPESSPAHGGVAGL